MQTPPQLESTSLRRYLVVLLGSLGLSILLVLLLNLKLGDRGLGNLQSTLAASLWQQATRGITYAPPVGGTGPFKVLRLADRLPEINALILGSSTLMGITQDLLPAQWRVYNLTVTGNSTAAVAGEARYIETHLSDRIHWVLAGLDWSLGMVYLPGSVMAVDLSPRAVDLAYKENRISLSRRLEDALSWPRVSNLGSILIAAFKGADPVTALQRTFFDIGGAEYLCADGSIARDFDVINRGLCRGYRFDGSWTFANDSRLTPTQAMTLSIVATAASSKYTKQLCSSAGEPNPEYLWHLGETTRRYAAKGGKMLFVLPPLVPGLETALLQQSHWKACLQRSKSILDAWGREHNVSIIDAGASERYGCQSTEFVDEHHAYPECNQRVLRQYFRDVEAGRVGPGLYLPSKT